MYKRQISVTAPIQITNNIISIDLGGYQQKLSVSAPLTLTGNTLSITMPAYVLAATLATTLADYVKTSVLSNYVLSSVMSGYATTASLGSYAQVSALSSYATLTALGSYLLKTDTSYQRTLTATSPIALTGNVLSLDTTGLITAAPATNGNVQLVSNNQIRCLNSCLLYTSDAADE